MLMSACTCGDAEANNPRGCERDGGCADGGALDAGAMDAGTDGGATDAGRGDAGADGGTASIANCVLMLDSTFGGGGLAASPLPPSPYPNALVQQADGKIVVAGLNAMPIS